MLKILHFADAHIDSANYGRLNVQTGISERAMDFLRSLDEIVDTAIQEKVDLVIFSGDAYRDRSPKPTFQREWGKRMMRLSHARIPTILLTGNHDTTPNTLKAHALNEFDTLEVPYLHVVSSPSFLRPENLDGVPLQVIAIPWVFASGLKASLNITAGMTLDPVEALEKRLTDLIYSLMDDADPDLSLLMTAHATIAGAKVGTERTIMLGKDLTLPAGLVKDPRLSYVALGHIHKAQNLNEGNQPPVIYSGSIERVDFSEAEDDKYFVVAHVEKGKDTRIEWRKIQNTRKYIDLAVTLEDGKELNQKLLAALPSQEKLDGAVVRMVINYPKDLESMIDDASLKAAVESAFEFKLVKKPETKDRTHIFADAEVNSLSSIELLERYLRSLHMEEEQRKALEALARQVIHNAESDPE